MKQYKSMNELPELCVMADLVEVLPVSRATLYRMADRGMIPCLRIGRRFVFSREHLKSWVENAFAQEAR